MSDLTDDRLREIAASSTNVWASDLTKQVCAELLAARQRLAVLERLASANKRMIAALDKDRRDNPDAWAGEQDPVAAEIERDIRSALDAAKERANG